MPKKRSASRRAVTLLSGYLWEGEYSGENRIGWLEVTSDASSSDDIRITLQVEGESALDYDIAILSTDSVSQIADKIVADIDGRADWDASADDELVQITHDDDEPFSLAFEDTGSTGATADTWMEGGYSAVFDTENLPHVTILGRIEGPTTLYAHVSHDGETFFYCDTLSDAFDPEPIPDYPLWQAGADYLVGDIVEHGGDLFVCLQAHKSNTTTRTTTNTNLWASYTPPAGDYPRDFILSRTIGFRYLRVRATRSVISTVVVSAKP